MKFLAHHAIVIAVVK